MDNTPKKPQDNISKRPPMAVFVWLVVILAILILFVFKFNPQEPYKDWSQTKFEKELADGNILSAEITTEPERVMTIEGTFKMPALPNDRAPRKDGKYSVRVLFSENLDAEIRKAQAGGLKVDIKNRDTWFRSLLVTVLPVLIIVAVLYFLFSRQIRMAGKGAMQFGKSRARMIMPNEHNVKFADVAGADEAKEETKEIVDYLKDPLKFKMLGGKIPKGALLMGPPGTGKTMLAKAVSGEANVPFFSISGSDFVEMFVGVGASRVRDMFEQARKCAPCLIFIDEIDAVGRSRFSGIGGGHDEREQTLNAMLVEMDGLETQEGVIVLAATNRPDVLDPALLRPGRFDRQIVLDLPDIKGRRQILDVHVKNIKVAAGVNLDTIARGTPGFSGADLANLVNEAALLAARNNKNDADMADFEEARDKVRWGRERKSKKVSDKERKITAYHEAGHTLVGLFCEHSMPLHKVTIIPRGQAYLGATMHLPEEDRYTQSKSELLDELVVCMGGRVAEEIAFKEITSGAAGDIQQATHIARAMVCAYGMSDKLGTVQYGERSEHIYVGRDITKVEPCSEETTREIDIEVKQLIEDAKSRAEKILIENKDKLELLSQELLEKETLDVKEVKTLLGMKIDEEPAQESSHDDNSKNNPPTASEVSPSNLPHAVNITA